MVLKCLKFAKTTSISTLRTHPSLKETTNYSICQILQKRMLLTRKTRATVTLSKATDRERNHTNSYREMDSYSRSQCQGKKKPKRQQSSSSTKKKPIWRKHREWVNTKECPSSVMKRILVSPQRLTKLRRASS